MLRRTAHGDPLIIDSPLFTIWPTADNAWLVIANHIDPIGIAPRVQRFGTPYAF
ncbi:MAG: hypothetical protein ACI85K_002661 [Hyphomicrobiaceae bacterium]|jgi:hypothetical protein